MKAAIITHPILYNYGGILQNYSLQQALKSLGHEVYTIDRIPETSLKTKVLSLGKRALLKATGKKVKLRGWQTKEEQNIINKNTRSFVKNYINTTRTVSFTDDLNEIHKEYNFDAYVVGSDQVWRRSVDRGNKGEFLSFLEGDNSIKKITYAASFGVDYWEYNEGETAEYARLAKLFDAISVREDDGVDLCKEFLGVDAKHLVDPTLLLNKEDYIRLVEKASVEKSSGTLFCYVLDRTPQKNEVISTFAEKKGLIPFEVMPEQNFRMELTKGFDINKCVFPPIEQWLRAFMDAEFVITDSFHGTVFSILFNKPFIAIINKKRGASRFSSLLKMFDMEYRAIDVEESVDFLKISNQKIDFEKVNAIIEEQKALAFDFLKASLVNK